MRIASTRRVDIEIRDGEIETLLHVARLAFDQLNNAPVMKFNGIPLEQQAGIAGHQLPAVKQMIHDLGRKLGGQLPDFDEPPIADERFPLMKIGD